MSLSPFTAFASLAHLEPFQLGGGVTIDTATGPYDDGFLSCARTGWSNPRGDSTFVEAGANLASYGGTQAKRRNSDRNVSKLVLVGHGNSGIISTGDGMVPRTVQGYISAGTYSAWAPYFAGVAGHGVFLTLCGCDCGADAIGAQFLYQLATLLNMPVQGRSGIVYLSCPGAVLSYENGSVWQVATPGVMPTPIPKPNGTVPAIPSTRLWFCSTGSVKVSTVDSVLMRLPSGRVNNLPIDRARTLLALASLDKPFTTGASASAHLTAQLNVRGVKSNVPYETNLTVFNDRLIRHDEDTTIYNSCGPAFTQELQALKLLG